MKENKKINFIIIYSDGPMGSTNLGAIFEQYGYINIPFRKFLLSEYVMGLRRIDDKAMQYKCLKNLECLSQTTILGGVSVKDRHSRGAKIRALNPNKKDIEEFISFKPKSIYELLEHCFLFTAKHIIYKRFNIPIKGFIVYEMPQFHIKYSFTQLEYINRLTSLRNFKFFTMNRPFKEWCASLLSQEDYKLIKSKALNTISIEKLLKRWENIQSLTKLEKVHTFKLESVLLPNTQKTNLSISKILNEDNIEYKELSSREFDLYGSLLPFNLAYTPSDKSFEELNPIFKIFLNYFPKLNTIFRFISDVIINIIRKFGFFRAFKK